MKVTKTHTHINVLIYVRVPTRRELMTTQRHVTTSNEQHA